VLRCAAPSPSSRGGVVSRFAPRSWAHRAPANIVLDSGSGVEPESSSFWRGGVAQWEGLSIVSAILTLGRS
jgi:hypothetical protein